MATQAINLITGTGYSAIVVATQAISLMDINLITEPGFSAITMATQVINMRTRAVFPAIINTFYSRYRFFNSHWSWQIAR